MKFGKYFIVIFLSALIIFAVALYTIYSTVKDYTIRDLNYNQTNHAQQAAAGIRDYMTNVISSLNFLSRFPEIIELNDVGKRIMISYQSLNSDEIKGITRVDALGKIIFTVPFTESIVKDISYQDHIRMSIKTHKTVISDVFTAVQGFRTVAVHVPVFKKGVYDGTIAFLLSFEKIAQKYIENISIGANGYAWVINEKGKEISSPFPDHIGRSVYEIYGNFPEIISMADEMLKGKEGITVYHYNKKTVGSDEKVLRHAVYMPITFGNTFWSIVISTQEDDVIASLSAFRTNLFIVTIALLMICMSCMYLIVRFRIVVGEQKKREDVLTALQESEAHYRYLFENNPASMLIYEIGDLNILAVNDAFMAHYGYSKAEALALKLPDLYPESEKKAISGLTKTLHGQAYVGEWHHLKKDGTYITIEVHSHGIQYEGQDSRIAVINDVTKRKLAEETLRERERQILLIYDTVGDNLFNLKIGKDGNYCFTSVNRSFLATTGLKADQIVGKKVQEVIPEPGLSLVLKKYAEAIREKKIVKWEEISEYPNGRLVGDVSVAPVFDDSNNCIGLVGSVHDITDRKIFEDTLQKSEELYRTIFENTGTAAVLIEENTVISLANTEFEKLSKYSKREMEGKKTWTEFVVKEDLDRMRIQHKLRRENRQGALTQYEFRFVDKYGDVRNILLTIDVIPGTKRSIASLLDITERKLAEEEIKKADRVYAVLSNINQAIVHVKDKETLYNEACRIAVDNGRFRMAWIGLVDPTTNKVNPVASAGFTEDYLKTIDIDLTDEELGQGPIGRTIKSGIHYLANDIANNPEMIPWRENALRLEYKSSASFPIKAFGKTIGAFMLYSEEQSFFNEAEIKLLDEMAIDISFAVEFNENEIKRKQNEEEVHKLNAELEKRVFQRTAQLEAANKELEAFSYTVSHDLRAPLRHASGYVDLLLKKCKTDLSEKGQHYLESIADSVHQMGILIDDLLQFSRTGRIEMRQSILDMKDILQEVIESLKSENKNRKIKWIVDKLPSVFCDGAMMKLVWVNLLSNAVKFTRTRDEAKIEIGVKEENSEYVFHIKDNGVGFDMKYAQKLFGVFQRLHSMDEFEGTGIGLANVRRIIGRHGGRTWADAEQDKGAFFYFTLPKK